MAGQNTIADGFETVIRAIDPEIIWYSEPEEVLHGRVSGEIFFRNQVSRNAADKLCDIEAILEFSTPRDVPGWGPAMRRIRDYTDFYGSKSVIATIRANPTLSTTGVHSARHVSTGDDIVKEYTGEEDRWTKELVFLVRFNGD